MRQCQGHTHNKGNKPQTWASKYKPTMCCVCVFFIAILYFINVNQCVNVLYCLYKSLTCVVNQILINEYEQGEWQNPPVKNPCMSYCFTTAKNSTTTMISSWQLIKTASSCQSINTHYSIQYCIDFNLHSLAAYFNRTPHPTVKFIFSILQPISINSTTTTATTKKTTGCSVFPQIL